MSEQAGGADETTPQQQFQIQRIYVKDLSFESPHAPGMFSQAIQPRIDFELNTDAQGLGDDLYEVVLTITVQATHDDRTAFLVEIKQAGIFHITGFGEAELGHMMGAFCPNILFPYAREAVSSTVVRGGFPPLMLAPVNFDALYQQHLQQQQAS